MGCGGGRCSANGAKAAFPCVSCANQKDPASGCTASATCPANGPMIYTPFPNSPVADVKFNLIVVGCELDKIDKIAIVPVQKLDAGASATTCGDVVDSSFASECTFQMDENNAGPNSSELYTAPNDCRSGVKFEGSFPTFSEGSTARHTRLGVHNVHFSLEYVQTFAPADFMVCFPSTRVTPSGELVEVWRAVAGHNEDVSAREYASHTPYTPYPPSPTLFCIDFASHFTTLTPLTPLTPLTRTPLTPLQLQIHRGGPLHHP